ncbi:hypothetical protein DFH09DRAFT_1431104 [Mycena vulgaris]|nr:hypothetical protein DFH09DRAFT_1431104 [Mycena vulgaris]
MSEKFCAYLCMTSSHLPQYGQRNSLIMNKETHKTIFLIHSKRYKGVGFIMGTAPRTRDVWTPRVRGVRAAPAATTLMPRVRGISKGVDTTSDPPKDTGREDEEGSTQAPARDTDATASAEILPERGYNAPVDDSGPDSVMLTVEMGGRRTSKNILNYNLADLSFLYFAPRDGASIYFDLITGAEWSGGFCSTILYFGSPRNDVSMWRYEPKTDRTFLLRQEPRDLRVVSREPGIDHSRETRQVAKWPSNPVETGTSQKVAREDMKGGSKVARRLRVLARSGSVD